jgi:Uma2 family endonuclease
MAGGYNPSMSNARTMLSAEQFLRMPPQEGKRFELNEGELVEMTFPNFEHNRIIRRLVFRIDTFLQAHPLGEVFPSDSGFLLSPDTVRGPDVSFLRAERARLVDPKSNHFDGPPDLAVEVVSPSDSARDVQKKVDQYLKAGAHTVWVVYPDTREVLGFTADHVQRYGVEDMLEDRELLPGFSLPVSELFD